MAPADILEEIRRQYLPDSRWGVFDVRLEDDGGVLTLRGEATIAAAVEHALLRLAETGIDAADAVLRLPDPALGSERHALVRAALAPLYAAPSLPAPQISELVLGMRVELLSRTGPWRRIRGEDGYVGWCHAGYLKTGSREWATAWERGEGGEPVVSLGAELVDDDGRILARLPWGARLLRHSGAYQAPDSGRGSVANGEVVDVDRLADRFPARGESIVRTARRWLGSPYLWGGISLAGVDCSGFTQAVMWMHGIALPRDSDMQAAARVGVDVGNDLASVKAGDLLFFAEAGTRITHVAISIGGHGIIHSAITNGGVNVNDLSGEMELEQRLAAMLVRVRRVLAD
jgi:gamma-D-glutamyl-L-lysine dipeptidyl-peptidase